MNQEAQIKNKKGLIVIGGGITGLSTALTWAINQDLEKEPVILNIKIKRSELWMFLKNI